mmetsp:Transcript_6846/g.16856  ORF Transcript_6846/g.16856 Transcript_6846/m.16856 type:complete len:256 (-) Transcript_6846:85-852(-)
MMRGGGLRRPGILGRPADAGTLPRAAHVAPSRRARGRGLALAPRGLPRRCQALVPPGVSRGRRYRLFPAPAMSSPPGGGGSHGFVPSPAAGKGGSHGFLARDGAFPRRSRPPGRPGQVRPARIDRLGSLRGIPRLPGAAPAELGARTSAVLRRGAAAAALPPLLAILLRRVQRPQPMAVDLFLLPLGQSHDVVRALLLVRSGLDDDGARRLALGRLVKDLVAHGISVGREGDRRFQRILLLRFPDGNRGSLVGAF